MKRLAASDEIAERSCWLPRAKLYSLPAVYSTSTAVRPRI